MSINSRVTILGALLTLCGCTLITDWIRFPPPSQITPVNSRDAAFIVSEPNCLVAPNPSIAPPVLAPLILGAFLPVLGEAIANAVKTAAQQAKTDLTATYLASGIDNLPLNTGTFQCLELARGTLGPIRDGLPPRRGSLTIQHLRALGLAEYPSLYTEVWVVSDISGTGHLTFRPVFIQFADTAAKNPGNGVKSVGIVLALSAIPLTLGPGTSASDIAKAANVAIPLSFGKLARGTEIKSLPSSEVSYLFKDQSHSVDLGQFNGKPLSGSISVYGYVTESSDPSFFDKVVIDTLTGNSLSTAISTIVKAAQQPSGSSGSR